jgi:hypothetical protein
MICPLCEQREAVIHSRVFDVSLCEACTQQIIEADEDVKRAEMWEIGDAPGKDNEDGRHR